jgi:hypothetical protein
VPAGSANGYGYATVTAHALISGTSGDIAAYAINQVEGSSAFIRNLTAFYGGRNAYSVTFATPTDHAAAISKARDILTAKSMGLHYPCSETISGAVTVAWRCQFLAYQLPSYMHVTGVTIQGKNLIIAAWFVVRPIRTQVK